MENRKEMKIDFDILENDKKQKNTPTSRVRKMKIKRKKERNSKLQRKKKRGDDGNDSHDVDDDQEKRWRPFFPLLKNRLSRIDY